MCYERRRAEACVDEVGSHSYRGLQWNCASLKNGVGFCNFAPPPAKRAKLGRRELNAVNPMRLLVASVFTLGLLCMCLAREAAAWTLALPKAPRDVQLCMTGGTSVRMLMKTLGALHRPMPARPGLHALHQTSSR